MKNKQSYRQVLDAAATEALRARCAPHQVVMNGQVIDRVPGVRYPGDPVHATVGADTGRPVFFRGAKVK